MPAYTNPGEAPTVQVYRGADLGGDWRTAACAPWLSPRPTLIIALAGRFASNDDVDALLARFGAISTLADVRYWSVTDRQWERLIQQAVALREPDLGAPRPDFTPAELKGGENFYFAQRDNRSSAAVIYRLGVHNLTPRGFVFESENVTPVKFFFLTVYPPGSLRTVVFLDRNRSGGWDYYGMTEIGADNAPFAGSLEKSSVNRAVALFRHIAGIPTDREPPAAP
jgi:hypothetical protein